MAALTLDSDATAVIRAAHDVVSESVRERAVQWANGDGAEGMESGVPGVSLAAAARGFAMDVGPPGGAAGLRQRAPPTPAPAVAAPAHARNPESVERADFGGAAASEAEPGPASEVAQLLAVNMPTSEASPKLARSLADALATAGICDTATLRLVAGTVCQNGRTVSEQARTGVSDSSTEDEITGGFPGSSISIRVLFVHDGYAHSWQSWLMLPIVPYRFQMESVRAVLHDSPLMSGPAVILWDVLQRIVAAPAGTSSRGGGDGGLSTSGSGGPKPE